MCDKVLQFAGFLQARRVPRPGLALRSQVQHQYRRPRARTARRKLVAPFPFLVCQILVTMIRHAFADPGKAGSANALFTGNWDLDPRLGQRFHDGLPGRDRYQTAAALQLDREGLPDRYRRGSESLVVEMCPLHLRTGICTYLRKPVGPQA